MEKFFNPQSVAVVGVSDNPVNLAQGIVANLLKFGFQGKILPVGPRGGAIFGLPIFPRLEDLPQVVDLATILTPAKVVPQVVETCGRLGINRVVVESAGFSELDDTGRAMEEEIRALLHRYRMRLVGPNGLGLINMETGLALPFASLAPPPRKGHIAIISQSGGVGSHLFAWMAQEGLGLSKFLSLGNRLDVAENEVLAYFLEDPASQAVYLYLEGLRNGRELMSVARRANKPIYLHAPNVGAETAVIAHSHTASLATDERVLEAACRQSGMLPIKRQTEFMNAAKLVGQPPVKGPRVVVLSRTGGEAVVTAYACRQWGFQLPPLSPSLAELLRQRSRAGIIQPTNPIDLGDIFDFAVYEEIVAAVCRDPEVDAILLNYGPMAEFEMERGREMARKCVEQARAAQKPVAVTVLITLEEEEYFRETLGVPVFHFPEEAVEALAASRYLAARVELAAEETPPLFDVEKIASTIPQGLGFLPLPQALSLVGTLGLAVAPWGAAATAEEAAAVAAGLGYPVCLKLAAASLVHKTEAGAVLLDLADADDVTVAFARLAQIARESLPTGEDWQVVVMAQVSGGLEVLLGARRDPAFGPVLACGAGGVGTEVLEDVSLRVAPVDPAQARELIAATRTGKMLAGIRGQAPADLEVLSRALVTLSQFMLQFPQIQEVDLNPVRAFPGKPGLLALDARIRVG
ncbi:MAG: acetate--CoA ligase family protein [Deltaproteobacteria bacterium]|nr:acetate--CoA ligase family protein [Deltaproteobacteria bacterium]